MRRYTSTEARTLVLRAYLLRVAISPCLRAELAALLVDVPVVLESFFQSALTLKRLPYRHGAWPVLQLTQCLTQAISRGQPTVLQAPHVTVERAELVLRAAESDKRGRDQLSAKDDGKGNSGLSMGQLLGLPEARRDALLRAAGLGAAEVADVCAFVTGVFPCGRLVAQVVVQGEESDDEGEGGTSGGPLVLVGDLVTVRVTLTLAPRGWWLGAVLPASCHAPQLPQEKPESWAVFLTEEGGGLVIGVKLAPPLRDWKPDARGSLCWNAILQLQADKEGERRLEAHAVCSAYCDADVMSEVRFEVRAMSPKKEKKLAAKAAREASSSAKTFGHGAGIMVEHGAADSEEDASDDEDEDPLAGLDAETRTAILQAQMEDLRSCGGD